MGFCSSMAHQGEAGGVLGGGGGMGGCRRMSSAHAVHGMVRQLNCTATGYNIRSPNRDSAGVWVCGRVGGGSPVPPHHSQHKQQAQCAYYCQVLRLKHFATRRPRSDPDIKQG